MYEDEMFENEEDYDEDDYDFEDEPHYYYGMDENPIDPLCRGCAFAGQCTTCLED